MPRYPLHPASGTGVNIPWQRKAIRLVRYGCANRPFFHIVVMGVRQEERDPPIEQLGTYDPMVNERGEKLAAINFERVGYWLGQGNVDVSKIAKRLLGLAGYLPIHTDQYVIGWKNRKAAEEAEAKAKAKAKAEAEALEKVEQSN